jgi:LytS/YehU family sensor histidine kinase
MTSLPLYLAPAALALVAIVGSSVATLAWTRRRARVDVADAWHTVDEEIAWLRRCAEAFCFRHGSIVRFTWQVTEGARRRLLPRAILQTIFDEAIRFGAVRSERDRAVLVRAVIDDATNNLVVIVSDDGPGIATRPIRQATAGTRAVTERLSREHPRASLRIESSLDGTRAVLLFPPPRAMR